MADPRVAPLKLPFVRAPKNGARGFTLIEVMIVMVILVAVMVIGAPRMFNTSTQMRSAAYQMAIMTREIRNVARLTNSTMRLVISINDEKGHSYWIEAAPGVATMLTQEQEEELKRLTESQREEEAPKNEFAMDSHILKKPANLPRGMFFESVEYGAKSQAVTKGAAFVHFFPQGLAEEVAIHLTNRKTLNWTIAINPLTGRAEVFDGNITLKKLRNP